MELAASLYKQDAAERTIARLIRERDQAREFARQRNSGRPVQDEEDRGGVTAMDVEESAPAFSEEQNQRITGAGEKLIAARKTRVVPSSTAKASEVGLLKETQSHSMGASSKKGLTAVARHGGGALAIGGADGTVVLWENGKSVASLKGHSKAVSAVKFAPVGSGSLGSVLSASHDGSVRLWSASSGNAYAASHTFSQLHSAEVTALTVHPCGSFFASASRDSSWSLVDLHSNSSVFSVKGGADVGACSAAVFHPDGFLLATTTEDPKFLLRLWDISSRENVISFPGHAGRINSVAFNENGFYLATGSVDKTVKLWDLRNLNEPMFASEQIDAGVNCVQFDHSGELVFCSFLFVFLFFPPSLSHFFLPPLKRYLAASSGADVQLYHVKTPVPGPLEHLNRLSGHTGVVSDLVWGPNARSVITVSADHTLKIFA